MRIPHITAAVAVFSATTSAVSPSWLRPRPDPDALSAAVLPPKQDPWYSAPNGYESAEPGAILKVRVAPGNLLSVFPSAGQAYHILYRTTDSRQNPSWAVTTLFVPASLEQTADLSKRSNRHGNGTNSTHNTWQPWKPSTTRNPGNGFTTSTKQSGTNSTSSRSGNSFTPSLPASTTSKNVRPTTTGDSGSNSTSSGPANSFTPSLPAPSTTKVGQPTTPGGSGSNSTSTGPANSFTPSLPAASTTKAVQPTPPGGSGSNSTSRGPANSFTPSISSSRSSYTTTSISGVGSGGNGTGNGTTGGNHSVGNGTTGGGNDTTGAYKLLSYQIPYDSADRDASPSYALYSGGNGDISSALQKGWFVNVPDYEGPDAAFTAGHISGQSTLDSVRAVLTEDYGLSKQNTKYVLWGYSGGALASEWAAELQPAYAPELDIAGIALGGLTPNVLTVANLCTGTVFAGLIPAGVVGLTTQWPALADFVQEKLNKDGAFNADAFYATRNYTLIEAIGAFANQRIENYFVDGAADLTMPVALEVINADATMGLSGVPAAPLYVYKGVLDQISPVNETDALVDKYCAQGVTIQYERDLNNDHINEDPLGKPGAVDFLTQALSGQFSQQGCVINNNTASA